MKLLRLNDKHSSMTSSCFKLWEHQKIVLYHINKNEKHYVINYTSVKKHISENMLLNCMKKHIYDLDRNYKEINSLPEPINIFMPSGTGKSYIALSIINEFIEYDNLKLNLIVCPSALISQWIEYLKHCNLFDISYVVFDQKSLNCINLTNKYIILLSSSYFDKFNFKDMKFLRCFIDEQIYVESKNSKFNNVLFMFCYFMSNTYKDSEILTININPIGFSLPHPLHFNINAGSIIYEHKNWITITDDIKLELQQTTNIDYEMITFRKLIYGVDITNENKIKIINERVLKTFCPICLLKKEKIAVLLCCKITICVECVEQLNKCIYCPKELTMTHKIIFDADLNFVFNKIAQIKTCDNSRIIVAGLPEFVSKNNTIARITKILFNDENLCGIIQGPHLHRNKKFDDFKNGKIKIIYFPTPNVVFGHNLEFATDIIFIGNLDNNLKTKIAGMAQRYGRTSVLKIHDINFDRRLLKLSY